MSRSLIQTANQSAQTVAVNSTIALGSTLRRFGCNCRLNGNSIEVDGAGYYTISGTVTLTPSAVGNASVAVYVNGVQVAGSLVTGGVTTVGNSVTLPIETTIRQGCNCDGASQIQLVLTAGASTVNGVSLRVEKV